MRQGRRLCTHALLAAIAATALSSAPSPAHALDPATADVRAFGATGDGITDDTAAIQRANDAMAAVGGGRVVFPPGTYMASGIQQDSGVELTGTKDAILKHPDGTSGPIVTNRRKKTTGSIGSGAQTLTVASATDVVAGRLVAILGAGGGSPSQETTLAQPLAQVGDPLVLSRYTGFPSSTYVLIEDEIVNYAVTSPGQLTTVRARLGTPAVPHEAGAKVSQLRYLYARVMSVAGNVVTIDRPADLGVKGATVYFGTDDIAITGLTIDGNRPGRGSESSSASAIEYRLVRNARITGNTIRNGDHGGVNLDTFSSDSLIADNVLVDNGSAVGTHGASIWLFRGSSNNTIRDNAIGGDAFHGVFLDDRTQTSSTWDGPTDANIVERNLIEIPPAANDGILVVGASDNTIRQNAVRFASRGIRVEDSKQGIGALLASERNEVVDNVLTGNVYGVQVSAKRNRFIGNLAFLAAFPYVDSGIDNVVEHRPGVTRLQLQAADSAVFGEPLAVTARLQSPGPATGTVQFSVDGVPYGAPQTIGPGGSATLAIVGLPSGDRTIGASYSGDDNLAPSVADVRRNIGKAAAVVTVSVPTATTFGAPVDATADVKGVGPVDGSVRFAVDGVSVGAPVDLVGGIAKLTLPARDAGEHEISATYLGGRDHSPGVATRSHRVNRGPTVMTMTSNVRPIYGDPIVATARVASAAASGGTVRFTMDGQPLGDALPLTGSTASVTIPTRMPGTYVIAAAYSGDANNLASAGQVSVVMQKAPTAVVATPLGRNVMQISARLSDTHNKMPLPGRTLTFTSRGTKVCTAVTDSTGLASCGLAARTRSRMNGSFTATFAGDAGRLGSAGSAAVRN